MRVPLSWLREFVDMELSPEALAERLTLLGMEVKGIERRGDEWRSVVVGELLAVTPHPNTTRLAMTSVHTGDGGPPLAIVCGATNIAPGQRVPVALPGAVLPGGRSIGVTSIAGAESQGMLCSGDELRLTADADGILILPPETPVGRPLVELYGDVVLDVDVKPNRGDALSIAGLAREVAAATGARLRWPDFTVAEEGDETAAHIRVDVRDPLCPRFVARYLDGLSVGPSPVDVQLRLTAAGMRPVSNVVDATNYVMLELGKPTHAFDAAAVTDGTIVVRRATPGETLETLDHLQRELDPDTLLIADPVRALGIAGVMGGADSEVGEGTSAVVIESAIFDPVSIRRTGQRHGLRSEASLRFEKGQEHRLARLGADRVATLMQRWAGGRIAVGVVDTDPAEPAPTRMPFRPRRLSALLGVPVATAEIRELLGRAEVATEPARPGDAVPIAPGEPPISLGTDDATDALVALIPTHRRDLQVEADLAEEVARIRGYETIEGRVPDTVMPAYRPDPRRLVDGVRDLLAGRGLNEVVTFGLIAPDDHDALGLDAGDPATIRIGNPVAADHSELRRSLLPGLVRLLVDNERQRSPDVALFEVGAVHEMTGNGPTERQCLGVLLAGDWQLRASDQTARPADASDAKSLVAWLLERVARATVRYVATDVLASVEHPGRTSRVVATTRDGAAVGVGRVGELDPRYLARYEARAERAAFAIVDLAAVAAAAAGRHRVAPVPRLPAVERDLAVVVDEDRAAGEVEEVIRAAAGPLLHDLRLFDRYQGPQLGPDEVSLAYSLRLQPPVQTLTDAEVEELMASVAARLRERLGARVRGYDL